MRDIEYYKQLDDILADEINVKNVVRSIGMTEEGELKLNYNRSSRQYTFILPTREKDVRDDLLLKIMQKFYENSSNKQRLEN